MYYKLPAFPACLLALLAGRLACNISGDLFERVIVV